MSYFDYESSRTIASGASFYGIIMAAMRKADDGNLAKLTRAWPEQWAELQLRYNSPGGLMESEREASERLSA